MADDEHRKRDWSWVAPGIILVVMTIISFAANGALESLEEKIEANKNELKEDVSEVKADVQRYSEKVSSHIEDHPSNVIFVELGKVQETIRRLEADMADVEGQLRN